MNKVKVIICPGNGCNNIRNANWYGQFHDELTSRGITSVCQTFPDPYVARRSLWLPFIESLGTDTNTILVGHSSGAQAALRYAETHELKAIVLVSATYSDLGDAGERASGYYPQGETNLYDFEAMKRNVGIIHQFHSDTDPFIPLKEAEQIRDGLGIDDKGYHMLKGRSHFFDSFPELMDVIESIIKG
ncbi:hypothetical protein SARC_07576 [Sphaeroforma arctica JP610]|uniref:AB hydrolase-1 domain-containing protein n=1 Tax=Sphaeroforma arctica JP610 TaxID=667725 RepID=A0A0L0FTD1_9EUKA|nr:hypothetical protein SARC_07576 [Sphaeroforma arctica JP610]KNC80047.1 hypothetical protein SARC_07576 [Sphaeroforma arctica JP610]|eukprot:XP_014153949.1 hypothetical protein SARC_07576 [Sphaeroforma arctica JP610]